MVNQHDVSQLKRVAVIYGTRPEAIKMAPLIRELKKSEELEVVCISTQQHSSLLSEALDAVSIETDVEVPEPDRSSIQALVSSISLALEVPISTSDLVVVQGDTISAFAGALAAFLQKIPVAHLEAGLRTSDLHQPHPEEGLRRAITHLSSLHLAPTPGAKENLESEGVAADAIVVTGNTSIDAIKDQLRKSSQSLNDSPHIMRPYCVLTVHRRENWGARMDGIARSVERLAQIFPQVDFICPLHPNPIVRASFTSLPAHINLKIVDPIPHDDFVHLLSGSQMILTDSGGIQEEVTILGVPVVILREETERPEVITAGLGFITGTNETQILEISTRILQERLEGKFAVPASFPFGNGSAGLNAASAISQFLEIA
jgi:UDP-N-acetylglucosamine 2-epimerase (non-hydrolysing)